MKEMLIDVIVLGYLLLMSLIAIIIIGIEDGFCARTWVFTMLFIFAFPIWLTIGSIIMIKSIIGETKGVKCQKTKEEQKQNGRQKNDKARTD